MDERLAIQLTNLNNRFYRDQAQSFSHTRQAPWPGWECCWGAVEENLPRPFVVNDVACGNLRFEAFLAGKLQDEQPPAFVVNAFDSCESLLPDTYTSQLSLTPQPNSARPSTSSAQSGETPHVIPSASSRAATNFHLHTHAKESTLFELQFHLCDVMEHVQAGTLVQLLPPAHLSVAFGFMHHIPLPQWRVAFVKALLAATRPGGFVCVSLWRFADDAGMAEKARTTHEQGLLDIGAELNCSAADFNPGDYLVGWRNTPGAYRYCHSFTDTEIDQLVDAVVAPTAPASSPSPTSLTSLTPPTSSTISNAAQLSHSQQARAQGHQLIARFQADGRTGALNEYLIFRAAE